MTRWAIMLMGLVGFSLMAQDQEEVFAFKDLPKGAAVTLPHPAITYVPSSGEVRLTSTDLPQIIKLSGVTPKGTRPPVIKVAIYDNNEDRVQHLTVRPNGFVVYSFKSLDSIRLVAAVISKGASADSNLKIESNKPLGISH